MLITNQTAYDPHVLKGLTGAFVYINLKCYGTPSGTPMSKNVSAEFAGENVRFQFTFVAN